MYIDESSRKPDLKLKNGGDVMETDSNEKGFNMTSD